MAQMNYLTQCTFDFGALAQTPRVLKGLGVARPFVVTDPGLKANGLLDRLLAALGEAPAGVYADTPANPTESASAAAAAQYRDTRADGIVALGGGSSMDLAKAVGLMVSREGPFERLGATQRGMRFITTGAAAPYAQQVERLLGLDEVVVETAVWTGDRLSVNSNR